MIDFGQTYNTAGYFWHPSDSAKKYPGTLDFGTEIGVEVVLMNYISERSTVGLSFFEDSSYLYGYIQGLGYITLCGCYSQGVKSSMGADCYYSEFFIIESMIIGKCVNLKTSNVHGISFYFPELVNMIDEQPLEFKVVSKKPILEEKLQDDLLIQIKPNFRKQIDIKGMGLFVGEKDTYFMQSDYYIELFGKKEELCYYVKQKYVLEKLFSILCNRQVRSLYTFIKIDDNECQLIYKIQANGLSIPFKSNLPVTIDNMKGNFQLIWKKWLELLKYDLVDRYIIERFYNLVHAGTLQYCLLVPMIEAWQIKHSHNKDKYENYFEESLCGNDDFCKIITQELFNCTKTKSFKELGCAISDIRNLILHTDTMPENHAARKKYGNFLINNELMGYFCNLVCLVVSKRFYNELGLNQTENQKNNLLKYI
ncbi:MAG: hypothetical protein J6J35_03245 [Alphaproteobacteria bacterium]|nr:hypothetical protein [Alphaproteobacteria bacterium]